MGERPYDPDRDADPYGYAIAGIFVGLLMAGGGALFLFIAKMAAH